MEEETTVVKRVPRESTTIVDRGGSSDGGILGILIALLLILGFVFFVSRRAISPKPTPTPTLLPSIVLPTELPNTTNTPTETPTGTTSATPTPTATPTVTPTNP